MTAALGDIRKWCVCLMRKAEIEMLREHREKQNKKNIK